MEKAVSVVITLLKEGFNVDEIQDVLNISPEEFNMVLKRVKELGYFYKKEVSSDGEMIIRGSRLLNRGPSKSTTINVKDNTFHTIFTSDFHLGGPFEKPERIAVLKDYAVAHNILRCNVSEVNGIDEGTVFYV